MKAPGEKGIIQIIVTSYCSDMCSNCTQLIPQQRNRYHMAPGAFRVACESLADWNGIVGVFGGTPTMHPQFEELCRIMVDVFPDKARRGLWTNALFGHGELVRETFSYLNLVVHTNRDYAAEMRLAKLAPIHGEHRAAWHSPVLVSLSDMVHDENERRRLIEDCDINKYWSGAIHLDRDGSLRAWYCEVASSMARAYNMSGGGVPVTPGWWRLPVSAWQDDIDFLCHKCGIPLRAVGHKDTDYTDDVSSSHASLMRGNRLTMYHNSIPAESAEVVTDYMRLRTGEKH